MTNYTCTRCSIEQPSENFATFNYQGKTNRRSRCRSCENVTRGERRKRNPNAARLASRRSWERHKSRWNEKKRVSRQEDTNRHLIIWEDSRKWDNKKGLENDLTKEFIQQTISDGCSYCGEQDLKMTLDRIDNSKGHTQDNVIPACIRCNYMKRDMPHEAWLKLIDAIRSIRTLGLFGSWTGRAR